MTTTSNTVTPRRAGHLLLWIGLVLSLVVGGMFLAVALTSGGDARTGGWMVVIPAAIVVTLCAFGLSRSPKG